MILNLIITKPYPLALTIVQDLAGPMILANSLGMLVFAFIISNLLKEQKTKQERDYYLDELERHKYELKVAQKIQKSFLPNNIPSLKKLDLSATNIPAKDAGGDFYDFIKLSDEETAVVIADVSDRKVPATLLMAVSRTIIRSISESAENPKPSQLVEYLNRLITEKSKSDVSLTLFYGILSLKNKQMNFINAGHSPPLVYKSKEKKIISLEKTDVLLGVKKNIKLKDKKISLDNDDIILFHTDGIYSVTNKNGKNFNNDLIGEILTKSSSQTSQEIINNLKDTIRDFCGKGVLEDDISLIVIKIK
jgi:phosphoserine phosphatase RsbU/P